MEKDKKNNIERNFEKDSKNLFDFQSEKNIDTNLKDVIEEIVNGKALNAQKTRTCGS